MQLASKLKRGDEVIVITGKDKGKRGKITQVFTSTSRVLVEGVNVVNRHVSARVAAAMRKEPGIEKKELPIHVSNVMFADPKTGKPTRLSYKTLENGTKVRVAKKSGTVVDAAKDSAEKKPAAKAKTKAKGKE